MYDVDVVVPGEPASAKNQRRIVQVHGKPRIIKSKKALDYARAFAHNFPKLDPLIEDDVALRLDVWYASRRPDLGAMDLVMDLLQGLAYVNDRQVKASVSTWNLDRENPRTRVRLIRAPHESSVGLSSFKLSRIWPEET